MDRRKIALRNTIQRSLKIDVVPEALPVMMVIGRLVTIVVMVLVGKFLGDTIYLDDILIHRGEYLRLSYILRAIFLEIPAMTFIYNIITAIVIYKLIKNYNALIEGSISGLRALGKIIEYDIKNLEELKKHKINIIVVLLAAYNAFTRFLFLAPILAYLDIKTLRGCRKIAAKFYEGGTAAMEKGLPILMPPEIVSMATPIKREAPGSVLLRLNMSYIIATLLANAFISIPGAILMHRIIRRVNSTIRVCRRMADTLASTITIS